MYTYIVMASAAAAMLGMNLWFKQQTKRLERKLAVESSRVPNA